MHRRSRSHCGSLVTKPTPSVRPLFLRLRLNWSLVTTSGPRTTRPSLRSRVVLMSRGIATHRPSSSTPSPPQQAGFTKSHHVWSAEDPVTDHPVQVVVVEVPSLPLQAHRSVPGRPLGKGESWLTVQ